MAKGKQTPYKETHDFKTKRFGNVKPQLSSVEEAEAAGNLRGKAREAAIDARRQQAVDGVERSVQAVQTEGPWRQPELSAEVAAAMPERKLPIGREEVRHAMQLLDRYREEREALTERIIEDQAYYEFTNTGRLRAGISKCKQMRKSYSAHLFNSIANKHADFMDNLPMPAILPREASDAEMAKTLTDVIPCILEQNHFEDCYSENSWEKLIAGTSAYAVTWNGSLYNGLGDIQVKHAELINLYWQGGIADIQDSQNLFYITIEDNESLVTKYPMLKDKVGHGLSDYIAKYRYEDSTRTLDESLVVDWYYKKQTLFENAVGERIARPVLHYCKFCNGEVIFASENEPRYEKGYYEHGLYPFVLDVMFPLKGSPAGFGYVDIAKNPQEFIDELDDAIRENARIKAKPRYFVPNGAGVNDKEFLDLSKNTVKYAGNVDGVKPIETPDLPAVCLEVRTQKIEELKETSGNRDFSQGSTSSGVTAASAIAALQEAGSKLSRDMIKGSYIAYTKITNLVIELMREFYTTKRIFRVTRDNNTQDFVAIDNSGLRLQGEGEMNFGEASGGRMPYFDVKVSAQKASPFSRVAQNELAKELYSSGAFNPAYADQAIMMLEMMDFDGKDEILEKVNRNAQLFAENQQLKAAVVQLSGTLAVGGDENSAALAEQIAAQYGAEDAAGAPTVPGSAGGKSTKVNSLGGEVPRDSKVDRTKEKTAGRSEVR